MFHPFLDTSKLTEEEIAEKLQKLFRILSQQDTMGHTAMYQDVLKVIQDLELELQKRASDKLIEEEIKNSKDLEFGEVTNELGIDYDKDL